MLPEKELLNQLGYITNMSDIHTIAGCDEVGRGSLAGPVVACCVVLKNTIPKNLLKEIKDSKELSAQKRLYLSEEIKKHAYFAISEVSTDVIDQINILQASLFAMKNAYESVTKYINPSVLIVDGNKGFENNIPTVALIKGDSKSTTVAAASIIAKTHRDYLMKQLSCHFPEYNWDKNCGYATKEHLDGIIKFGININHRKTFAPIKNLL